jgi:hypothetical protein
MNSLLPKISMLRMASVSLLLTALNGTAIAQTEIRPAYTINLWLDRWATVPGSAFTKAVDGGRFLTGTIIVKAIGATLDQRCCNK